MFNKATHHSNGSEILKERWVACKIYQQGVYVAHYGPEQLRLKDDRIVIVRHCAEEDVPLFPDFQKQIARETTFTMQTEENAPAQEKVLEAWSQSKVDEIALRLGVFHHDKLIGQLGFRPLMPLHPWVRHVGQFGMMVMQDYWGHGIGSRLLEIMEVHAKNIGISRIEAMVRVRNERGVALYKKHGYEIEGIRKNAALIKGEFWDEFYIGKINL